MAPKKVEKSLKSATLYTVGWIAALTHERAAALVMLDERHDKPKDFVKNRSDTNSYTWGRIGEHNIVIASLPFGEYGTVSAAGTVHGLLASLPHIHIGLFVGIGAGVPRGENLLLGDVVVSEPSGTNGGVVQYDLYKAKGEGVIGNYERKGFLNSPPRILRGALSALQAEHETSASEIARFLEVVENNDMMRLPYGFPGSEKDPLRTKPDARSTPAIHYGTIASGNVLIKSSSDRDGLVEWLRLENIDPLCFEMEAAGLMNSFPCLVIRGICDYADEHKNDTWQRYATVTAAAFAKELLGYLDNVELKEATTITSFTEKISKLQVNFTNELSDMRTDLAAERESSLLQAKLGAAKGAAYYSYATGHASTCLEGTRTAVLSQILTWATEPSGKCIFWLCGMAGTGKSTIARTIAKALGESHNLGASFFFKRGEADRKNAVKFFPTIVLHMTRSIPEARSAVAQAIDANAAICEKTLEQQFEELLVKPFREASQIIDALDECEHEQDTRLLLVLLSRLSSLETINIRVLVTSRPELPVRLGFKRIDGSLGSLSRPAVTASCKFGMATHRSKKSVSSWSTRTFDNCLSRWTDTTCWQPPVGYLLPAIFTADSSLLATTSPDRVVHVWDTATGRLTHECKSREFGFGTIMAFSHDGSLLALVDGGSPRLKSLKSGRTVEGFGRPHFSSYFESVDAMAFSTDDKTLACMRTHRSARMTDYIIGEGCDVSHIGLEIYEVRSLGRGNLTFTLVYDSRGGPQGLPGGNMRPFRMTIGAYQVQFSGWKIRIFPKYVPRNRKSNPMSPETGLQLKGEWLQHRGRDLLWLPPEYRGEHWSARGNTLVIARPTGALLFLRVQNRSVSAGTGDCVEGVTKIVTSQYERTPTSYALHGGRCRCSECNQ
ncbi:hypothetical protein KVT40_006972 [Elsinoe batatas]|uniref:NACHT domain-containing protein n=1 Tax=Elsinoe batatas TaxID=2601811 RepID=A0A8K0L075_9PEZI|nr:hypothetical protein KVT40_006972 [Elsinoe batatas]